MNNNLEKYYKYIWLAVFVVLAILSFTLFHDMFLKWGFVKQAIVYLDNKTNTILGLTAASSSASVAVTMIPGDIGTPIANKLADISSYSIIILAAVHLEKYLITLGALVGLKVLLPVSLVFAGLNTAILRNSAVSVIVKKVAVLALALVCVIPVSVKLSMIIEDTYKDDMQINIEQTQQDTAEIQNNLDSNNQSIWDKFISKFTGGASEVVKKFEDSLNNFIEAISVMLITACVIPVLTFMVLLWLLRSVLQIDLQTPGFHELAGKVKINPYRIAGKAGERKQIEQ